jgi:RNA polymerase sigma-70 factor (ECF subfamily)
VTGPDAPGAPPPSLPAAALAADSRCREWFEAHGTSVYGYLRFHLASVDEAEDLTSDVFLRAIRAADRFDPARGSPKHWLLRIARNALRDHLRRERRRRGAPAGAMYDLRCDAPSPEERLLREEQVARLLEAVSALGQDDRELIGLRYGSGLDTAEAADILGVSQGVLRTRLWRALARLRKALEV